MKLLSAVIITFNEEKNIARCLESIKEVADEIIVVDSFSTDGTEEICTRYPVQFHKTTWKGYSQTKNQAQALAKYDYILSLDADECLTEELKLEILNHKKTGFKGVYSMNRLTNYCGKWIHFSGWNPDWKIRIFPKKHVRWNDSIVHEELIVPNDLIVYSLNGRLQHYSYISTKQHREKADQYSRLTAKKYAEKGKKSTLLSPILSAFGRFISMYFLKLGFLDGKAGWQIAKISALSNAYKYKELRRLNKEKKQ